MARWLHERFIYRRPGSDNDGGSVAIWDREYGDNKGQQAEDRAPLSATSRPWPARVSLAPGCHTWQVTDAELFWLAVPK